MARLRLTVNETKSTVASVFRRKFLGYSFWVAPGGKIKRRVADKAMATFKQRVRELTRRSGGHSLNEVVKRLRSLCAGMEGLLPAGGYSRSLERSGQMDTPPHASHPTQAMETRHDHLSRTTEAGSFVRRGGAGGG